MSHPLLIKVLRDVYWEEEAEAPRAPSEMVYAIPPAIADRLERALDVCDWNGCGRERTHSWHGDPDAHEHDPKWSCHSFTPLVTP